jgi:NAD(P)-dependent dehydrogenase (short-subunit alcohol dehydrogenase family)
VTDATRVAVVTGAASGIGLGVARRFAADGNAVALLDSHGEAAENAAADLRAQGATAMAFEVDVANWSAVHTVFEGIGADLGPVGILVTCAGIESFDPVLDITQEAWDRILAVNLTGTFTCVQAALSDMIAAGWGRIVTIASSSAQSGTPRMAHYTASKAGVIGLTKSVAREFARKGITANCIPPSLVDTPMARNAEQRGLIDVDGAAAAVPIGRAGTPDDIAAACSFLCSDDAGYITGQLIGVNGGMYI